MLASGLIGAADPVSVGSVPPRSDQTPAVSVRLSSTTLRYPGRRGLALTFTITTGATAQSVGVGESAARWPDANVDGWPLAYGMPVLRGAGRLTIATFVADFEWGACLRGSTSGVDEFFVDLPANTTTTVVQPVSAVSRPPWPGTDYTPRLKLLSPGGGVIAVPHVRMTGQQGVHIRLRAAPILPRLSPGPVRGPLRPRRPVVIRGATSPSLADAVIDLSTIWANRGHLGHQPLGRVRTDRAGRFRTRPWRPHAGTSVVFARLKRPGKGLAPDGTCGLAIDVGG
jgi:hypothetical protein